MITTAASPPRPEDAPLAPPGDLLLVRRPARLLVAEDDTEMRRLLVAVLRKDGHEVTEARDGHDLLARMGDRLLVRRGPSFDLIISDIRMPGPSGLEILGQLRGAGYPSPVVLITAFGDAALHEAAARLGAAAVFDKPVSLRVLRAFVQRALRSP
jgi:CheY-like chemotaxis protein